MAVHSLGDKGVMETQRHQWEDQEGELGRATEKEWEGGEGALSSNRRKGQATHASERTLVVQRMNLENLRVITPSGGSRPQAQEEAEKRRRWWR